jgi:hypothetical protein
VIWFDPGLVRFKISPHDDLKGREGGDWDLERRFPVTEAVKHRAIVDRYRDGRRWEDTELFASVYARRFDAGEGIRGEWTMNDLVSQYYTRVDGMFADLNKNGFRTDRPLPKLLIGRDGEIFIGNQGNHRLAMAQVLGLSKIAGEVICRHKLLNSIAA